MSPISWSAFGLIGLCVTAEIAHELTFKLAANRASGRENYAMALIREPWLWGGIGLWIAQTAIWIVVLQSVPLVVAFPLMTLSYVGVPAASALLLKERMTFEQSVGAVLILAGVLCIGLSAA
ncbi:MAG: EamA family transporter [Brevundimonas sp.]